MEKERLEESIETCHGVLGDKKWPKPYCVAKTDKPNREDQGNMTSASEYLDEPEVLEKKMEIIANLIKKSKCVVAYTGAGLSRAAGIGDYGSKAENSIVNNVPKLKSAFDAQPTYAHHVIAKLEENDLVHYYVQQNHDGLPQKAGFPQEKMNEIHGAWYDPSNPVVQFSGSLRSDLFKMMTKVEKKVDFCLCLGTSLSGMNADRTAWTPAKKFVENREGNGTIMINLQRTKIDKFSTIRVWAKLDDAFKLLVQKLGLDMTNLRSAPKLDNDVVYIPYDEEGKYLGKDCKKLMKLDFSIGAKVKIVHPDSSVFGEIGEIYAKYDDHYTLKLPSSKKNKFSYFALGTWWVDVAVRGALPQFSFANVNATFKDVKNEDKIVKVSKQLDKLVIENKDLLIGNTHQKINDSHKWCLYVKPQQKNIVDYVEFHLHPTFNPCDVIVREEPFQIERTGWGTFKVMIDVFFKDGDRKSVV